MNKLLLSIIALVSLSTNAARAADVNVTGTWAVTVEVQGRPRQTTMKLKQEGQKLSGTFLSATGAEVPITGNITGDKITFSYPVTGVRVVGGPQDAAANLTVTYNGTVVNNAITAKAGNALAGDILLTAKKN